MASEECMIWGAYVSTVVVLLATLTDVLGESWLSMP